MIDLVAAAAQAAGSFDPEAATRAWLDTLQGPARARSDAYFEGGYWLLLWNALVGIGLGLALLHFGWSAAWRSWAERVTGRRWLQPALYAVPYVIVAAIALLPWSIYAGWYRERQYGLMNLTLPQWLGEQAIGLAVQIVVLALLLTVVFAVIRRAPRGWWLWGSGTVIAFMALMMVVSPVFLSPLFNDYRPMEEGPLRDSILEMARAHDVPADNIYVFDQSKQHNRISANVSGLGPTIRISLNDNLLARGTPEEVRAVMGHELGHYVLNHGLVLLGAMALILLAGFWLLWRLTPLILARYGARWGVRGVDDPAVLPLFAIILTLFMLAMTPVTNSLVRTVESQADAFGLDAAREPDGFASVAMKLSEYRKIEPLPLEEVLFFDHPSGATRVRMAMDWKARDQAARERSAMTSPASASSPPAAASADQR
ncbi:MAG: M48 family metallopeptidase [Allosphingosinicella sp.]|uniref:M48 family metallopeptidase n=1 Tax=Allosphingosinicella sp. TaxID=2823234 RepID=UPI0039480C81